jgi:hypothetical protein
LKANKSKLGANGHQEVPFKGNQESSEKRNALFAIAGSFQRV